MGYGWQVLTLEGIPVEFCFMPGSQGDAHALTKLPLSVAPESIIWTDAAYTDYKLEDLMIDQEGVWLLPKRKSNSKRKDEPWDGLSKVAGQKNDRDSFLLHKGKDAKKHSRGNG